MNERLLLLLPSDEYFLFHLTAKLNLNRRSFSTFEGMDVCKEKKINNEGLYVGWKKMKRKTSKGEKKQVKEENKEKKREMK